MLGRSTPCLPGGFLAAALALGVLGCGHGFTVRGQGRLPVAIAATGSGAGASAGAGAGTSEAVGEQLDSDHDGDLPALAGSETSEAASGEESGSVDHLGVPAPAPLATGAAPAKRYGAMDRESCETELGRRNIAFERVDEARGVIAPLRLKGALAGVDFHSMLPLAQRRTSPLEIYDCRLVLALDDWARVLARYDVVEVVHYSVYRPPSKKRKLQGAAKRHGGALAIDAAIFKTRDGQTLSVEKDFHGRIGGKPCAGGAASTRALPASAVTLRKIVCEAADAQLFNVMLTPDYNRPHRNHFHLEVTAGARWTFVR